MPEFSQDYRVLEVQADGTVRPGLAITVTPEENDKARNGYFCWHCGEDWSGTDIGAWPDRCPVCGQTCTSEEYARLFDPTPVYNGWSPERWREEEDRLDRQDFTPRTGIWLPDNN